MDVGPWFRPNAPGGLQVKASVQSRLKPKSFQLYQGNTATDLAQPPTEQTKNQRVFNSTKATQLQTWLSSKQSRLGLQNTQLREQIEDYRTERTEPTRTTEHSAHRTDSRLQNRAYSNDRAYTADSDYRTERA